MIVRPAILVVCASFLSLPLTVNGQTRAAYNPVNSLPWASQGDSAGRASISDETSGPAVRSSVQSDQDTLSTGRTIEPVYCQVLAGAYFSGLPGPQISAFNYLPLTMRYGWALVESDSEMLFGLSRNIDFVLDLTVAGITTTYGTVFGGPTIHLRKNFADPGERVIPYVQAGLGFLFNDAFQDKDQKAIGHFFEFTQKVEVGIKWMVAPDLSLDVAFGAQHISNANLADRNLGVNAFGGQIGLTYYFSGGRSR